MRSTAVSCSVPVPTTEYAVRTLTEGRSRKANGFNRAQEYAARRRGKDYSRLEFATREILTLDPLPCWRHLSEEGRRRRVTDLVEDLEAEAAAQRERKGSSPWASPRS